MDLANWSGVPRPERITLEGRYVRIEPLDPARHGAELFASAQAPGAEDRFRYLFEDAPADYAAFSPWLEKSASSTDPLFFAVIDKRTGRAEGRQALMRIDSTHGVIEIGSILWGPAIARSRATTETLYLFASYVFDTLGYRRFEWKCNNLNEPSKRAAVRYGFKYEGLFRQHQIVKGKNRDTAWYSILDSEWPARKAAFQRWLAPNNFDKDGRQMQSLAALNAA